MAGAVGRGGGHSVDGQGEEEHDVEEEHDEVDVAAESVPLVPGIFIFEIHHTDSKSVKLSESLLPLNPVRNTVPDESRAERVAEQVRPPLVDHDHERVVPLQVELGGGVGHRSRVQLVVQPQLVVFVGGELVFADQARLGPVSVVRAGVPPGDTGTRFYSISYAV